MRQFLTRCPQRRKAFTWTFAYGLDFSQWQPFGVVQLQRHPFARERLAQGEGKFFGGVAKCFLHHRFNSSTSAAKPRRR